MDKRIRFGGINRTEGVWGGEGNGDFVDLVNMHPGERGHLRVVNRSVELAWGKDVGDVGKKPDSNPGLEHLTGKVAQYYGLEESHIKVQWKDD